MAWAVPTAAALIALSSPASASIFITSDQQTDQGDNILFPTQATSSSLQGVTQDGYSLTFTSLTGQTLSAPSNGAARIEPLGGGTLDEMSITPTVGLGFDFIEFNLFQSGNPGSLTVTAWDQMNNEFTETFTGNLNGENFVFVGSDASQTITRLTFSGTPGATDIRQVRVGTGVEMGAVPEPSTWAMMLFGFGAVGFAMRRRKDALGTKRLRLSYS
jgi:hypothetical protein